MLIRRRLIRNIINSLNAFNAIIGEKLIYKTIHLIYPLIKNKKYLRRKIYLLLGTSVFVRSIEMTTRIGCPPNCSYCPQNNLLKAYNFNTLATLEEIKLFFSRLHKPTLIKWTGFVEPTTHPNILDFIELGSFYEHPQMISTTCSGSVDYRRLFENAYTKFTNIQFHLPDSSGYMKVKVTENYLENLRISLDTLFEQKFKYVACNCFGESIQKDVFKLIINHPLFKPKKMRKRITIMGQTLSRAGNIENSDKGIGNRILKKETLDNELIALEDNKINFEELLKQKNRKSQPSGTCARQRLNQHVILPDGSTVLCCMDYSLKTRQSKYKFDYASAIKEHNDQFMAGKYNDFCEQCEWFIKDQSD